MMKTESIFDCLEVDFPEHIASVNGYKITETPIAEVNIKVIIRENFKSVEDIEDIIANRWLQKKFGISLSEFQENFPEFFI